LIKQAPILNGEKLVTDRSMPEMTSTYHKKGLAVEMEAAGFVRACRSHSTLWHAFCGIADYASPVRKKDWQALSSLPAAAAARLFIDQDYRNQEFKFAAFTCELWVFRQSSLATPS
jgi:nucleoside phosphorylase